MANIVIRGGNEAQTMTILAMLINKLGGQITRVSEQYEVSIPTDQPVRSKRGASGDEGENG